jgi:phosphoribosylanthranilate isomerase
MENIKIKICGMRDFYNIRDVCQLLPDYIGFIFYNKSERFVGDQLNRQQLKNFPTSIKKVGVFVDPTIEYILEQVEKYDLNFVQLHGDETPEFCRKLKLSGIEIIKVFRVDDDFDFNYLEKYKPYSNYFLFDTKSRKYGGSGETFNWNILKNYDNKVPFFLSGGIGLDNIKEVKKLNNVLNIYAIDVNSKFEITPALKDINKIKILISEIRS